MRKIPILTILIAGVLVAGLLAFAFRFQVRFNEAAVKVRLGTADSSSVVTEPGMYFRWPWPIERVETFDRRLQVTDVTESEMQTRDKKLLMVGAFTLWKIDDPLQFYIRVGTVRVAERRLQELINSACKTAVAQSDLSAFVNLDANLVDAQFTKLEQQTLDEVSAQLAKVQFGIKLVSVGIRRLSLPESVTAEVFNSMRAQRESIASAARQEGEAKKAAIVARADSSVASILAFAESKAKQIEAEGQRAAGRKIEEVKPEYREFYIWLRRIEALRASLQQRSTIFLDAASDLMKDFSTPPTATGAAPRPTAAPAAAQDPTTTPATSELP